MKGRATTRVSIYRASAQDAYGDSVDDNTTPAASGVLASLIETNRRVWLPAENRTGFVKMTTGRVRSGINIQEGDRLRDESTGAIYYVEATSKPDSPVIKPDIRLVLRSINE